jgi:lycopene beta-cyclase
LPRPSPRHQYLDRTLLQVLARDPGELEQVFGRLFARNPPPRVLRFLDEDTSRAEEARIVRSLDPRPFLRAAARA